METLSRVIDRVVEGGFLSDFKFKSRRGQEVRVSHLLFAGDTLIFCKDNEEEMAYLSWTLMWFEATSGLRINMEKSSIIPMGRVIMLRVWLGKRDARLVCSPQPI